MGFDGGSGGEESAEGLGERGVRFRKNLTRRNRNRGSQGRAIRLATLLSFNRASDSLSIGGGGRGGHSGGGSPSGVQMAGGSSGTRGVLPFGEFLLFPCVGVFLDERLRVAIPWGRGS